MLILLKRYTSFTRRSESVMSKILILGAGNAQIDAIKFCQKKGYEVFGCSYTDTDKGISLLNHYKKIDIRDVLGVTSYASENNVSVVYSVGSDLAMPTAMKVSEKLNLKHFISSFTSEICQEKNKLRSYLGEEFKGNIKYFDTKCLEEAMEFEYFPCMMKPVDSQGQRGCYKINNKEDILQLFEKIKMYSRSGTVILEQYVQGPEVSVNTYMEDGRLQFCLVSGREVFEGLPGGIIKRHRFSKKLMNEDIIERIKELVKRTLIKLCILNGPAYFQIKISDGQPYIIEVTPRLDGCHMWNGIAHYCGVDLLNITLEHIMEDKKGVFDYTKEEDCILEFMCSRPGVKFNRNNYDVSRAKYHEWYYETGDNVKILNGHMEKCGYQIYMENESL